MLSVEVVLESKTVTELIEEVQAQVREEWNLVLEGSPEQYRLLMAGKSGRKKTDYPALDPSQDITMTGIKNFFLERSRRTG